MNERPEGQGPGGYLPGRERVSFVRGRFMVMVNVISLRIDGPEAKLLTNFIEPCIAGCSWQNRQIQNGQITIRCLSAPAESTVETKGCHAEDYKAPQPHPIHT